MKAVVALFAVGLAGAVSAAAVSKKAISLPSFVKACQRDQPEFDSCILSSLKKLHSHLVKGIPELDLPPFDPYVIDEMATEYVNGHVEGKMIVKDSVTYGLSGLQFLNVRTNFTDPDNMNIQIDIQVSKLRSEGKYKAQGKFIGSEFGSRGEYNLSIINVTATWDILGSLETIDGVQYLKVKHFDMIPEVQDMKIHASNLFKGNEELTKTALSLFNQYWRPVYKEVLPYVRESWDKIMRGMANRVFLRVPFDKIFPLSS